MTRREEEIGRHVAKTVLPSGVLVWVGLPYQRLDDAHDHLPVAADVDGDHRLNVEHVLRAVKRPGVEVGVVLQGNEGKTGNRILHIFLQSCVASLWRALGAGCRRILRHHWGGKEEENR